MTLLDVGTWNLANDVPAPVAAAAIRAAWSAQPGLHVLALQEMHGRHLDPPEGVAAFHPGGSEGEDDNALMWAEGRLELLDAYPVRLSASGWRTVRGGMAPRRVAPVALLRDVTDGSRHAFASVHLPPSLEADGEVNLEATRRLAVAAEALQSIGNHADTLRRMGFHVHVGGDWNVDALVDDGEHDAWPEAVLGDLLRSAWRSAGTGDSPGTFGAGQRMIDDWRTTATVDSVTVLDPGPSDHRLVIARLVIDAAGARSPG